MLALLIGIISGTYSSIYVAAPLTEWIGRTRDDARFARRCCRQQTAGG